jgi:hypothetical protein
LQSIDVDLVNVEAIAAVIQRQVEMLPLRRSYNSRPFAAGVVAGEFALLQLTFRHLFQQSIGDGYFCLDP